MPTYELTVKVELLPRPNGKYLVQYLVVQHIARSWKSYRLVPAQGDGFDSEKEALAWGYDHIQEDVQAKYPSSKIRVKQYTDSSDPEDAL